jgi:phosphate transport system substrate-binding protein
MRACVTIAMVAALLSTGAAQSMAVETGGAQSAAAEKLSGTITLSGAWALYPMAVKWAEEFQKIHPDVRIDIGAGGAGKGMADALAGVVDLGMVSRDVYPAEIERGAWWVSVTKDGVVPVVSESNPALGGLLERGLSRDVCRRIWMEDKPITWGDVVWSETMSPVRVYTRSDACGAAQTWAEYLGGAQEELLGVGVYGDPGLADAVKRDALGIGFNNINYVYDATTKKPVQGLVVVPIDVNADGKIDDGERFYDTRDAIVAAIARGDYPSPPARDLHFVSKGRPQSRLVVAFLEWVLTSGQRYVAEAGYIELGEERLARELGKLRG